MKVYLVRHGKTKYNEEGRVQGTLPVHLSKIGEMQCYELREKLKNINFDTCLCSPIFRAVQTAMILVGDKVVIEKDDTLREREIKCLEGITKEEIKKLSQKNEKVQDIEGNDKVFDRCKKFAYKLKEKYQNENILIVSHGIVIACLHYILNDYNLDYDDIKEELTQIDIDNCYCEKLEIK